MNASAARVYRFIPALAAMALLCVSALCGAAGDSSNPVTIERKPETCSTRYYNPAHPPPDMPPPEADEAGVTVSDFGCTAKLGGQIVRQYTQDGVPAVSVRVDSVHMTLTLRIGEWIDLTAPTRKILAHENGHRMISQYFYARADAVAAKIGQHMLGHLYQGSGPNAAADALNTAAHEAAQQYIKEVHDQSQVVQELYDQITQHGTNTVDEMDAIELAMKEANQHPGPNP